MIQQFRILFSYLFLLIPLFLITGPAIPDITITFGSIFGIYYLVYLQQYKTLLSINFIKISIIFWLCLLFISIQEKFFSNKANPLEYYPFNTRHHFTPEGYFEIAKTIYKEVNK